MSVQLKLKIITPERLILEEMVEQVTFPSYLIRSHSQISINSHIGMSEAFLCGTCTFMVILIV